MHTEMGLVNDTLDELYKDVGKEDAVETVSNLVEVDEEKAKKI